MYNKHQIATGVSKERVIAFKEKTNAQEKELRIRSVVTTAWAVTFVILIGMSLIL